MADIEKARDDARKGWASFRAFIKPRPLTAFWIGTAFGSLVLCWPVWGVLRWAF